MDNGSTSFGGQGQFLFGVPSHDPQTNVMYAQQAHAHAVNNPYDARAQQQAAYWAEVVNRQSQASTTAFPQTAAAAAAPGPSPGIFSAPQGPTAGAPVGTGPTQSFHPIPQAQGLSQHHFLHEHPSGATNWQDPWM